MSENTKHFLKGFRIGFAQGCVFASPFLFWFGILIVAFTNKRIAGFAMVVIGLILWFLGRAAIKIERQ